jgi:hypothetical protein
MHIFAPALPELMQQAQVARDPGPSSQGQLGAHAAFTREIGSGRIGSLVIRSKARRARPQGACGTTWRPATLTHVPTDGPAEALPRNRTDARVACGPNSGHLMNAATPATVLHRHSRTRGIALREHWLVTVLWISLG